MFYEPFLGGGSVLLNLRPYEAVVGDLNDWLLDTYDAIRNDWEGVAARLAVMKNSKAEFLRIRSIPPQTLDLCSRAAQFIYLNKTCFRGLFRVNRKGQFNVPYGAYDRRYFDPRNLSGVAEVLRSVEIRRGDFEFCLDGISSRDFAYLDPPYYRLGGSLTSTDIHQGSFVWVTTFAWPRSAVNSMGGVSDGR